MGGDGQGKNGAAHSILQKEYSAVYAVSRAAVPFNALFRKDADYEWKVAGIGFKCTLQARRLILVNIIG